MRKVPEAALIIMVSLTVLLAGCSKNASNQLPTKVSDITQTEDGWESAEPEVLDAYIPQFVAIKDVQLNSFTRFLEEKTNVKFKFKVASQTDGSTKLKLMLSSNNYPGVIMNGGFTRNDIINYGINQKIFIPLNKYVENSPHIKQILADHPNLLKDITAPDGNIYALPSLDMKEHGQSPNKLWVNNEWLKKLGMQPPKTTEELRAMLVAFKTKDPNGNGKTDEVALSGASGTWAADPQWYLMNGFILADPNTNFLILNSGKLDFAPIKPEWKQGLIYIRDLYKEGLIDPAGFTQKEQQLAQLGNSPTEVLGSFTAGHLAMGIDISGSRGKEYDALPPIEGPSGHRETPWAPSDRAGGFTFAITNKAKNPEAAMRVADYLMSEEGTLYAMKGLPELKTWEPAKKGDKSIYNKPAKYTMLPNDKLYTEGQLKDGMWLQTSLWAQTTEWLGSITAPKDLYAPDGYEQRLIQTQIKVYTPYKQKSDVLPNIWLNADTGKQMSLLQESIRNYIYNSTVEFITGKKDIDKDWDSYVKGFDGLKLQDWMNMYLNAIDNTKK